MNMHYWALLGFAGLVTFAFIVARRIGPARL